MKTRIATVSFLLTLLTVVASGCSFDSVTNLFATPTPTSTNTPLPSATPSITPSPTATATATLRPTLTPSPFPTVSWEPGVPYTNKDLGFSMMFPTGTDVLQLTEADTAPLLALAPFMKNSFMLSTIGQLGIFGFSGKSYLASRPMDEVISTTANNLSSNSITVNSTNVFVNKQAVELGRIDWVYNTSKLASSVHFVSRGNLINFTFIYNNRDEQYVEPIITGIIETIKLK